MKNDLRVLENAATTMSSREIAELTGKRHDNVMRDVNALNESYEKLGLLKVEESSYINLQNKEQPMFELTKMQTFDLMTGYNTQLRIKVNRRWEELENEKALSGFQIPQTLSQALMLAAKQAEEIEAQAKQIEIQKPKVEVFEKIANADTLLSLNEAAKAVGTGRNRLMRVLRNNKVLTKTNVPYQRYIERGLFLVKVSVIQKGNTLENYAQTFVTGKGLVWIAKSLKN